VGDRFVYKGWQFVVHSKDGARLKRVRLLKAKAQAASAAPAQAAVAAQTHTKLN
jgi:putative hemolysin